MRAGTTAGSSEPASVDIQELTFGYPGGGDILKGLTLGVKAGERLGIIGPSGAGKTTLLLHLNGILSPRAGTVAIDGQIVAPSRIARIREWVGLVFQDPDDQLFTPTVGEDVAFGPRNLGLGEEEVARRVKISLDAMDMAGSEKSPPYNLSYGERRRAALATVLAMEPRVLALDEPFANLGPALVERLIRTLRELPATVIIVSQAIFPLMAACDRMALLAEGRIQALGSTREIVGDRQLLDRYGLDFTFYLDSYRRLGF
ncbi:MAG: energy-coupling factor ABC transporter ATP-binding protein [Gemmatimonadota bacterium]